MPLARGLCVTHVLARKKGHTHSLVARRDFWLAFENLSLSRAEHMGHYTRGVVCVLTGKGITTALSILSIPSSRVASAGAKLSYRELRLRGVPLTILRHLPRVASEAAPNSRGAQKKVHRQSARQSYTQLWRATCDVRRGERF